MDGSIQINAAHCATNTLSCSVADQGACRLQSESEAQTRNLEWFDCCFKLDHNHLVFAMQPFPQIAPDVPSSVQVSLLMLIRLPVAPLTQQLHWTTAP